MKWQIVPIVTNIPEMIIELKRNGSAETAYNQNKFSLT